jgi:uncharacterized protein (DUF58 family)
MLVKLLVNVIAPGRIAATTRVSVAFAPDVKRTMSPALIAPDAIGVANAATPAVPPATTTNVSPAAGATGHAAVVIVVNVLAEMVRDRPALAPDVQRTAHELLIEVNRLVTRFGAQVMTVVVDDVTAPV